MSYEQQLLTKFEQNLWALVKKIMSKSFLTNIVNKDLWTRALNKNCVHKFWAKVMNKNSEWKMWIKVVSKRFGQMFWPRVV